MNSYRFQIEFDRLKSSLLKFCVEQQHFAPDSLAHMRNVKDYSMTQLGDNCKMYLIVLAMTGNSRAGHDWQLYMSGYQDLVMLIHCLNTC